LRLASISTLNATILGPTGLLLHPLFRCHPRLATLGNTLTFSGSVSEIKQRRQVAQANPTRPCPTPPQLRVHPRVDFTSPTPRIVALCHIQFHSTAIPIVARPGFDRDRRCASINWPAGGDRAPKGFSLTQSILPGCCPYMRRHLEGKCIDMPIRMDMPHILRGEAAPSLFNLTSTSLVRHV
jgi:hypothetical protein